MGMKHVANGAGKAKGEAGKTRRVSGIYDDDDDDGVDDDEDDDDGPDDEEDNNGEFETLFLRT